MFRLFYCQWTDIRRLAVRRLLRQTREIRRIDSDRSGYFSSHFAGSCVVSQRDKSEQNETNPNGLFRSEPLRVVVLLLEGH